MATITYLTSPPLCRIFAKTKSMTKGQVEYAVRNAHNEFDKWNDATGQFELNTGYYAEILSVIEDAVHIGIQVALKGRISRDEDGIIKHEE